MLETVFHNNDQIVFLSQVAMLSYSGTSAVKDSCSTTDNTCSTNAKCVGEFNCECEKGFYDVNGDGKTCSRKFHNQALVACSQAHYRHLFACGLVHRLPMPD